MSINVSVTNPVRTLAIREKVAGVTVTVAQASVPGQPAVKISAGMRGLPGRGLPRSGQPGQVLVKLGTESYAAQWADLSIRLIAGLQAALDDKQPLREVLSNTTAAFTSALLSKLNGIQPGAQVNPTIVDSLDSAAADQPLSANQGRILKGFVDQISALLQSDDTALDELQEIVDFIKINRDTLDSLSIGSIAGLSAALDGKQPLREVLTNTTAAFTSALLSKLNGIQAGAQVNAVHSVAGKTGAVTLSPADAGAAPQAHTHEWGDVAVPPSVFMRLGSGGDADSYTGNGHASGRPFAENHPPGAAHGELLSYGAGSSGARQLFVEDSGNLHLRGQSWTGTWGAWRRAWTSADFSTTDRNNWRAAYGWGDHRNAGYLTSVSWSDIVGLPTAFPPSAHTHAAATVSAAGFMAAADKAKLNGIQPGAQVNPTIVDALTSAAIDQPLSANQGRVLKGFIDQINALLQSDDTALDELQEIVDFIKINRDTLDSLSIGSIAGLSAALDGKQPLREVLSNTTAAFTSAMLSKLNGIQPGAQVNPTIVDGLGSAAADQPLSANQGRVLKALIDSLDAQVQAGAPMLSWRGDRLFVRQKSVVLITNYDSATDYTVSASAGSAVRIGPRIYIWAPESPQDMELTVNSRTLTIPVVAGVVAPRILAPVSGSRDVDLPLVITSTAFEAYA